MTWLPLAINLLKLLTVLSTWLRERKLIQEGRDDAGLEALKIALADLAKANGVIAEFKDKTDADVERTIEERGWYRDG